MGMLAHLLSSKPKTKLINLLLAHPERSFSQTELRISAGISAKLLKQALHELTKMEFVLVGEKKAHKYYQVNRHFALYPELLNLLNKSKSIPQDMLSSAAARVGECRLVILTGVFAGKPRMETDVLFVGRVSARKLDSFLKLAEKFAEQEINFTVLAANEFDYRLGMNDRFVKNILENSPAVIIDKIRIRNLAR